MEWIQLNGRSSINTLDLYGSDHRAVVLTWRPARKSYTNKESRQFYFEEKWLLDKSFKEDFTEFWKECDLNTNLQMREKLEKCPVFLRNWAGEKFDHLPQRIRKLRAERASLLKGLTKRNHTTRMMEIDKEIEELAEFEEAHWKARSRVNWLANEDRNTSLFHAYANGRRKRNFISGLFDEEGGWRTNDKEIAAIVEAYYSELFQSSLTDTTNIEGVISCVSQQISVTMRAEMMKPYVESDVLEALRQSHPSKAPGLDGFPMRFYQKMWPVIGKEITKEILDIVNEGKELDYLNETVLVLIPKVAEVKRMKDLRPISLCNSIYKIISKMIVKRLKMALSEVIDENQSAFLPGRNIVDNIVVGYECMHTMQ